MRLACFIGTSITQNEFEEDLIELSVLYQLIDEGDTTYKDYRFVGYVNSIPYQTGYNSHVTLVTVTQSVERDTNMHFFNAFPPPVYESIVGHFFRYFSHVTEEILEQDAFMITREDEEEWAASDAYDRYVDSLNLPG